MICYWICLRLLWNVGQIRVATSKKYPPSSPPSEPPLRWRVPLTWSCLCASDNFWVMQNMHVLVSKPEAASPHLDLGLRNRKIERFIWRTLSRWRWVLRMEVKERFETLTCIYLFIFQFQFRYRLGNFTAKLSELADTNHSPIWGKPTDKKACERKVPVGSNVNFSLVFVETIHLSDFLIQKIWTYLWICKYGSFESTYVGLFVW